MKYAKDVYAPVGTCAECGKQSFISRKAARRVAATRHPNESLTVYKCGMYWHYGHVPKNVRLGHVSRDDYRRYK